MTDPAASSEAPPRFEGALFMPAYPPAKFGRWEVVIGGVGFAPGYWSGPTIVSGMPALLRDGETWMSISPLEIESEEIGIRAALGHVVILGLGLGWAAAATACVPAVTRVTVVERDPEVIALHQALNVFSQLEPEAKAKLNIVQDDAFDYRPSQPVDLMIPDIWQPLVGGDRVAEVRQMQSNVHAGAVYFWGQELEIARHAAAAGHPCDDEGVAATAAAFGLPLVGPGTPGYAGKVAAAAERWMRGRWLTGPEG
ncbi:MAG: hypothetical protein QOG84_2166 [Sphingomonadales bacterium]|jgi:hypothetical protein|nr:hypothetical protein [Sphingomonadales bacterium]